MRLLLDRAERLDDAFDKAALTDDDLSQLYAWPDDGGVRANFVSTLDGSAVGADGRSGSINTDADERVFHLQRSLADCVLVGAGTARAEGYRRGGTPIIVVSARGHLPESLATGDGVAILVTCASAGREDCEDVWVVGEESVDLPALVARLRHAGMPAILAEGGPHLFHDLLAAGVVDELALTLAPTLVGGDGLRVVVGSPLGESAGLTVAARHLLEENGSLLGLWQVENAGTVRR